MTSSWFFLSTSKYFTLQTFPDLLNVKSRHFAFLFFQSCGKALCCKICILCYMYVLTLQSPDRNGNPGCGPDPHWSITVEQFVATLLTSQPIVDFFGRPASLSEVIMKMRGRRFNRLHSLSDTAFVKVWQADMWIMYREQIKVSVVHRTHTAVLRQDYRSLQCTNSCFWSYMLGISSFCCCYTVGPVFNQLFIAYWSMHFYMLVWATVFGKHLSVPCIVAVLFCLFVCLFVFYVLYFDALCW